MKKVFKRDLQSLEAIFTMNRTFCDTHALDSDIHYMLDLVLEELFTNALRYNADNRNDIRIELKKTDDELTICMVEFDVEPFDLNSKHVYDLSASLQERPVGKLGIHFIKKMLDTVKHEYRDRQNKVILVKRLKHG